MAIIPAIFLLILIPIRLTASAEVSRGGLFFGLGIGLFCGLIPFKLSGAIAYVEGKGPVFCGGKRSMGKPVFAARSQKQKLRTKKARSYFVRYFGAVSSAISFRKTSVSGVIGSTASPDKAVLAVGALSQLSARSACLLNTAAANIDIAPSFSENVFSIRAECIASLHLGKLIIGILKTKRR